MDLIKSYLKKMMGFNRKDHWENLYIQKAPTEVSWYQTTPTISLQLIASTGIDYSSKIIDVGGGASVLVDKLLEEGYTDVTVLDISANAIHYARERLKTGSEQVTWIVSDITEFKPVCAYDLWHDRAVFHFLTDLRDRQRYVEMMKRAVKPGGQVIISAFALQGPPKCSGLSVERYDVKKMASELGKDFEFIRSVDEVHLTPGKKEQKFIYCHFKRVNP